MAKRNTNSLAFSPYYLRDGPEVNTSPLVHEVVSTNVSFSKSIMYFLSLSRTSLASVKENIVRKPGLIINISLKSPTRPEQAW